MFEDKYLRPSMQYNAKALDSKARVKFCVRHGLKQYSELPVRHRLKQSCFVRNRRDVLRRYEAHVRDYERDAEALRESLLRVNHSRK